jgi:hypothetical protein
VIYVVFALMVVAGAGIVLNQVSDWVYAAYGAAGRWLAGRVRRERGHVSGTFTRR